MICQTHPHKDHTTGIKSLIKKYSDKNTKIIIPEGIEYVLDSLAEEERAIYNYMVKIVKDNKTNYGIYESANNNKMLDCKTYKVSLQRHNHKSQQKTEPTYTKTSLFQEKGGVFFVARFGKGVVLT